MSIELNTPIPEFAPLQDHVLRDRALLSLPGRVDQVPDPAVLVGPTVNYVTNLQRRGPVDLRH